MKTDWVRERRQITLRMPNKVYEALRMEAKEKGLTVNDLILLKISPLQVNFREGFSRVLSQRN